MSTLTRKGYARIYTETADDVDKVKNIINKLDAFEYEYLPQQLIAPFSTYPNLTYTHKFDGIDMNKLSAECWKQGIKILVIDNGYNEFLADP